MLKGTLLCYYEENGQLQSKYLHAGDIVCIGKSMHTFENASDETVEYIVFRLVLDGKDKKYIMRNDKYLE